MKSLRAFHISHQMLRHRERSSLGIGLRSKSLRQCANSELIRSERRATLLPNHTAREKSQEKNKCWIDSDDTWQNGQLSSIQGKRDLRITHTVVKTASP